MAFRIPNSEFRIGLVVAALHSPVKEKPMQEHSLTLGAHLLLWGFPLALTIFVVAETLLDKWWRKTDR